MSFYFHVKKSETAVCKEYLYFKGNTFYFIKYAYIANSKFYRRQIFSMRFSK